MAISQSIIRDSFWRELHGCGWTVPNTDFSRVAAIEVVNGDLREGPGSGISLWQEQLNKGFRLTGLGAVTIMMLISHQMRDQRWDGQQQSSMLKCYQNTLSLMQFGPDMLHSMKKEPKDRIVEAPKRRQS